MGETGSGDQRRRGCRHHQTIGHQISPQVLVCCLADNERRCAMFPDIRGSIDFAL
jgi:hypothetical protein